MPLIIFSCLPGLSKARLLSATYKGLIGMHTKVPAQLHNDVMSPYSLRVANSKEPISVALKSTCMYGLRTGCNSSGAGLLENIN